MINKLVIILGFLFLASPLTLWATDFSSANFTVQNPVIQPGTYSTSNSYQLNAAIGQISMGVSEASSFAVKSGFLYFSAPSAAAAAVTVTPAAADGGEIITFVQRPFVVGRAEPFVPQSAIARPRFIGAQLEKMVLPSGEQPVPAKSIFNTVKDAVKNVVSRIWQFIIRHWKKQSLEFRQVPKSRRTW